jgi:hypothetical protein
MPRKLYSVVSVLRADTSDLTKLSAQQIVKRLPYTLDDEAVYGVGGAYQMYADMYGEQASEMRANEMNPGTFKQWLTRQVSRVRYHAARQA